MPLILPGNVASATAGAFEVANSCRFNSADSPALVQTPSAGNADRWTLSMWFKRCDQAASHRLLTCVTDGEPSDYTEIGINGSDLLFWNEDQGGVVGSLRTNRKFRDVSAWMHLVFTWDSANGTAGNRMRIYINGTEETNFSTDTNPSSGQDSIMGTAYAVTIGSFTNSSNYQGCYFAEVAYCNGQAYAASDFGEFDEDSPTIWKPKDISGLTFGTGGFYLDFEDSANLGADVSGQGNDFTVSNLDATDQAQDSPTNNFCVLNGLEEDISGAGTLSEGNCQIVCGGSGAYHGISSTFWLTAGKWYWEVEADASAAPAGDFYSMGISGKGVWKRAWGNAWSWGRTGEPDWIVRGYDGKYRHNNGTTTYGAAFAAGTVISIALDLTNNKIYWAADGAWADGSGSWDSSTFDAAVGAISIDAVSTVDAGAYTPVVGTVMETATTLKCNFGGCPSFAISSGNADADGYGNFEYAVPSGFYALCTKNLAEYGG